MARYDRVIPPGGKGKVTLAIDTRTVRGVFEKKATIRSNDKVRPRLSLYLKGKVKPRISMEPGGYLSLWGVKGEVPRERLKIINHEKTPLRITGIESDIPEKIKWYLTESRPGYIYELEVEDISRKAGQFTGHIYIHTDNPEKPELTIILSAEIQAN